MAQDMEGEELYIHKSCARNEEERSVVEYRDDGNIFYYLLKEVHHGQELLRATLRTLLNIYKSIRRLRIFFCF